MSKNLKIFLGISYLIILFAFLYFIFTGIEINRLNDFSYYKELQKNLSNYVSENIINKFNLFFYFCSILGCSSWFWFTNFNNFWNIVWSMDWNFCFSNFNFSWSFNFIFNWKFFFRDLVKENIRTKI